ncbi:MAG: pantoate--beta-alanine ligase [Acidobacteria bacterium]|nr:pantoate--beta-alanine ligase [Acidobacteriota bacterium]
MSARLLTTIAQVREFTGVARRQGHVIGCVPTMGDLHAGHGALIERARTECGSVVVTVFVNPIQFDRQDDYERYTRRLEGDLEFCAARSVDAVFAPAVEEMYPEPMATFVDVPDLARHLCGEFRPGHFRGVATVVAKLFHIVQPDAAYFGEKDAQQLAIIQRMVRDLNMAVRIVPVPTVREPDGLAMSSRNRRLSPEERAAAPVLYRALRAAENAVVTGERDAAKVKSAALGVIAGEPAMRVEYLEVVDAMMQPVAEVSGTVRLVAAAWLGQTRLIDNLACEDQRRREHRPGR